MKITNKAQLQGVVTELVEDSFDKLFTRIHKLAKTTSGDIDPGAAFHLADNQKELVALLKERFVQLISQTVWWNMPEGEEDYQEAMEQLRNNLNRPL